MNINKYIVGLTGGIGCGKTTIANLFADLGVNIIDADLIARELVKPQTPALLQIINTFGPDIVDNDGNLNRKLLREKVFNNPKDLVWLNELLHPLIRQEILSQVKQSKSPYCILVAPLLLENKLDALVNHILVIDIDEQSQFDRVTKRDSSSESDVKRIMANQISRDERLAKADTVINNSSTDLTNAKAQVIILNQFFCDEVQRLNA